jgi:putative acetyltransferase
MLTIRPEEPSDFPAVYDVNLQAFEKADEADLVEAVRPVTNPLISLVALTDDLVIGHALFTPVTVHGPTALGLDDGPTALGLDDGPAGVHKAMGLGPVAVLPEFQGQGIGSRLIRAGLEACRDIGQYVVFVLGHPGYYPRFGFRPVMGGELNEPDIPGLPELHYQDAELDPYFMVAELKPAALAGMSGSVYYLPQFEGV